jgi:hypothetical protein
MITNAIRMNMYIEIFKLKHNFQTNHYFCINSMSSNLDYELEDKHHFANTSDDFVNQIEDLNCEEKKNVQPTKGHGLASGKYAKVIIIKKKGVLFRQ